MADVSIVAIRPGNGDLVASIGEVLTSHWSFKRSRYEQEAWESFWSPGLVDEATAMAWREEVWREEVAPE